MSQTHAYYLASDVSNAQVLCNCPHCNVILPPTIDTQLEQLLELSAWYAQGNALDAERFKEHQTLVSVLHWMQSHRTIGVGKANAWPTTLDSKWIQAQIALMSEFCCMTIVYASCIEQFIEVVDLLNEADPHVIQVPAPMTVYQYGRGWLGSAG